VSGIFAPYFVFSHENSGIHIRKNTDFSKTAAKRNACRLSS
jgi:hypothetical protein